MTKILILKYIMFLMETSVKTFVFVTVVVTIVAGAGYALQANHNLGSKLIGPQDGGNLDVYIYDMPVNHNVSAVYLTFSSVSLYVSFQGWTNYSLDKKTVQISNHNSSSMFLVSKMTMPPQNYTAIKLDLEGVSASIGGKNQSLSLASSEVFVSHSFSVLNNKTTNVEIMFDLSNDLNLNKSTFTPNIGSSFNTGNESSPQSGFADFYVYDAPSYNVSAVYMNFSEISLHGVQTGWTNFSVSNHSINVLGLTAANASLLGNLNVSAQNYTMIRLYIQNVTVTLNGINETFKLASPYAMINHPFDVLANGTVSVKIQFDLNQDVNVHSRMFTPLIGSA